MKIKALIGTTTLFILALKRDKIRLFAWILGISVITGFMIAAFSQILPTEQDIITMTSTHSSNPAMRVFLAPASGSSIGGFFMMRISTVIAITIALFGVLTITRHTRENEETGCEEVTGATVTGRHASLTAALLLTLCAHVVLIIFLGLAFLLNGLSFVGSLTAATALGFVGIAFSGLAAITAQLTQSSRGASGTAGLVMATFFLLSGTGNMLGTFDQQTLTVSSTWLVWLSPFGWYQQMHAFHQNNLWVLFIFIIFFLLTATVAFHLHGKRDIGDGIIPTKNGPDHAAKNLLSPLGLAFRMQKKLILVWGGAVLLFGTVLGAANQEFNQALQDMEIADQVFGDIFSADELFLRAMMSLLAPFVVFYAVQAFTKMVAEESNGYVEPILSTMVSRFRWMLSHIICLILGTLFSLTLLGVGGVISSIGLEEIRWIKVLESSLIQAPAIGVIAGIAFLLFGLFPRISGVATWMVLTLSIITGPFLGPAMDLPQWALNLSPFTHVPSPSDEQTLLPILVLSFIGVALTALGLLAYRHRDMKIWKA